MRLRDPSSISSSELRGVAGTKHVRTAAEAQGEGVAALDVQRLGRRPRASPHRLIIGEVGPESVRDLLRAPRVRPAPILTTPVPTTDPPNLRAWHSHAVGGRDRACEALLHVLPQRVVRGEAWPPSGAWHACRHATGRSSPDTPGRRRGLRRCDAAPARSSTGIGPSAERSHEPRSRGHEGWRSLLAR